MQLVILSGGKGTRLYPLTKDLPKTMVPINGKPILEYHIEHAQKQGVTDIIICIGHLPEKIKSYFGDGSHWGVHIQYSLEKEPLGTGGPLALIKNLIRDDFVLLNGDIMGAMNYTKLKEYHSGKKAWITIVTHRSDHPEDSDLIEHSQGILTHFWLRPHKQFPLPTIQTNAGVYFCNKAVLDSLEAIPSSFEKEIIPKFFAQKKRIAAYETNEYLKDAGTPERLRIIEAALIKNNGSLPSHLY